MKKVLFILHEDTRTGASLYLLNFLKWLNSKGVLFDVLVLKKTGQIEFDIKRISNQLFYLSDYKRSLFNKITNKLINNRKITIIDKIESLIMVNDYYLVYGNTIVTIESLYRIKQKSSKIKTVLHIHEGKYYFFKNKIDKVEYKLKLNSMDSLIIVSNMAEKNFKSYFELYDIDNLYVISPFLKLDYKNIFEDINNPPNHYTTISIVGTSNVQKGFDLIPMIVNNLIKNKFNFRIQIIGSLSEPLYSQIRYDLEKLNFEEYVNFIGTVVDTKHYILNSDVLLVLSREETFSLTALEAIQLGKKIICFERCVGLSEYFPEHFITVKYLDIEEITKAIILFKDHNNTVTNQSLDLIKQEELNSFEKIYRILK